MKSLLTGAELLSCVAMVISAIFKMAYFSMAGKTGVADFINSFCHYYRLPAITGTTDAREKHFMRISNKANTAWWVAAALSLFILPYA
ncbi:hypothetical protein [Foetidibacter luteolus]|uniref:hypothetical protein n=1 Tax=Foetidibacter luteolus TaxID=2608880 RepID=UPI00129A7A59|nr:hypothetical protein [Foetidibacter luteolus]